MDRFDENGFISEFRGLLDIDSTTGYFRPIQNYIVNRIKQIGFDCYETKKGGVVSCLGGEGSPMVVTAHLDDIGLMVRHIKEDGTLKVVMIGGLHESHSVMENVRVYTRDGRVYTGTVQRDNSSAHVSPDKYWTELPDYDSNVVIVLDEDVKSREDVYALGIRVGDIVALEPRFTFTNGYIKSRFIDDKAQAAIVLEFMKAVKNKSLALNRKVYVYFAMYEEIGHGTAWIPEDTVDILSIDIACCGPEQTTDEKKVTIFAKDSRFPYHYEFTNELIDAAERSGADYVIDVFTPHYGTDGDTTIVAGHDVRHAAIGPGTMATHGYERSHMEGMQNTYALLTEYLTKRQ